MRTVKILGIIAGCFLALTRLPAQQVLKAIGDFQLDVDVARFYYDEKQVYTEVYYGIREGMLAYRQDSGRFVGGMNMKLEVRQDSVLVMTREWGVPHTVQDTARLHSGKMLVGVEAFGLAPGTYRLIVTGYDILDKGRRDSVVLPLRITSFPTDTLTTSDIELCSSIQSSTNKESIFYKNTYEVVPNAGRMYGMNLPVLYYYVELYNVLKDLSRNYLVVRSTVTNASGKELIRHEKTKLRKVNSNVEAGTVKISSLRGGTYELHIALMDSSDHVFASTTKKFFMYKPGVANDSFSRPPSADVLTSEYAIMTEAEVDKEFAEVQYITSVTERKQYERLTDVASKRAFLFQFWRKREKAQEGLKMEYMKRVQLASESYSNGFREGWKTDRGRVSILYGPADEVERFPSSSESNPYEIWHYNNIQGGVIFVFVDRTGFGDYILVHSTHRNELQDENWYQEYAQKMQ